MKRTLLALVLTLATATLTVALWPSAPTPGPTPGPTPQPAADSQPHAPAERVGANPGDLQRQEVPGRLLVFHDANHWIMKGEEAKLFWSEMHRWLAETL